MQNDKRQIDKLRYAAFIWYCEKFHIEMEFR